MKNKNEKGFALILSLTLLLVMSLLGGSLIVITSSDHQSNNTSDEYQQAFYVAETALLEAEKDIINTMMGEWLDPNLDGGVPMRDSIEVTDENVAAHNSYVTQLQASQVSKTDGSNLARDIDGRKIPQNVSQAASGLDRDTECFNSFKNIVNKDTIQVVKHKTAQSFLDLIISPLLDEANFNVVDPLATEAQMEQERERMSEYFFEYFSVNLGSVAFKGSGSSLKKTTTNVQKQGTQYKLYGCGYLLKNGNIEILIPLETIVTLES
tara:strand:+ start:18 stop:815 length:798 start_codon:yes stop_codon:yes gene_type:complete